MLFLRQLNKWQSSEDKRDAKVSNNSKIIYAMGAITRQNYFTSVWVGVKATKGIVTKRDEQAILDQHFVGGSKKQSIYINFKDKGKALNLLTTFSKPLTNVYECRIFTDMQMSKCEVTEKGLSSPFTKKQMNEVYYI